MDGRGKEVTHKCVGVESSLSSNEDIHFQKGNNINPYTVRQYGSTKMPYKDGVTQNQTMVTMSKEIWNFLLKGRISITAEYLPGKLNVLADKEHSGFKRLEIGLSHIPRGNFQVENSRDRSLCFESLPSNSLLQILEDGSIQSRKGCLSNKLEQEIDLSVCSILPNRKGAKEVMREQVCMMVCVMVSSTPANKCQQSNSAARQQKLAIKPKRGIPSFNKTRLTSSSGLACIRKTLEAEGVSERDASLMTGARRAGTTFHYQSAWRKWSCWCNERKIDPIRRDVNCILDFLAACFEEGLEHSTIAGYRSAISAYHDPVKGVKIGEHPRVTAISTGVFNNRPPKPKYTKYTSVCYFYIGMWIWLSPI